MHYLAVGHRWSAPRPSLIVNHMGAERWHDTLPQRMELRRDYLTMGGLPEGGQKGLATAGAAVRGRCGQRGGPEKCDHRLRRALGWGIAAIDEKTGYPRIAHGQIVNQNAVARRGHRVDRTERIAVLVAEVGEIVREGLEQVWDQALGADLGVLEVRVQQLLRLVGGRVVEGFGQAQVAALERTRPQCARCGKTMRRVGRRARQLVGLVGDSQRARPYYHCRRCGAGVAPLDEVWGLDSGVLTPGLARAVCRDGIEAPFGQAASLVAEHLGVALDEELVRRVTEHLGALADADQAGPLQPAVDQPVPETLVVELDGGMVHLRQAGQELKAGRVAPLGPKVVEDPESGDRYLALGPSLYCAGVESCNDFWPRLVREARRAGLGRGVKRVIVLADGAEWIWVQARCQLAFSGVEVIEILDFYHASQHLSQAAAAVYGGQSEVGKQWLDKQCHTLRHHGVAPVLAALDDLQAHDAAGEEVLRQVRAYMVTHAARLDYPAFRARLFPIGSGAIESTVKNLIQAREVLAGMRWTREGAHAVANLRALHRSVGRWAAFWHSRPLRRAQALVAPPVPAVPAVDQTVPAREQHASAPACTAPPHDETPPHATSQTASRIQTEGKPWGKGKHYWGRSPIKRALLA